MTAKFCLLLALSLLPAVTLAAPPPPAAPSPAPVPAATLTPPYVLAGDDVLSITVLNFPKLSVPQATVAPDGTISMALLPAPVSVLGKTTAEVRDLLSAQLKQYVINPAVTVTLVQKRQENVLMYGFVAKPGATPYKPPMHLLELMAWAGGALPNGDLKNVAVTHRDGTKQNVDLSHPERKGGTDQDLMLQNGDVAYVPERRTEISIVGEVLHPGSYDYKDDMSVLDAISLAGPVNPDTCDYENSTVTHNGKVSKLDLDGMLHRGDMAGNIKLSAGDTINIPIAQNRTYVFGAVGKPGYYLFKPHDRILDAITGCGGTVPDSDLMRINVIHINKDKTEAVRQQVNLIKFLKDKNGKIEDNMALAPGDVIYVPYRKKTFGLSDIWNVLAPLNLITQTGRIVNGSY